MLQADLDMLNKNTLLSQSAYAWLGVCSGSQTFGDESDNTNIAEIKRLLDERNS